MFDSLLVQWGTLLGFVALVVVLINILKLAGDDVGDATPNSQSSCRVAKSKLGVHLLTPGCPPFGCLTTFSCSLLGHRFRMVAADVGYKVFHFSNHLLFGYLQISF